MASQNADPSEGMAFIDGCSFPMGSERFYPEESPVRQVRVEGFWIDKSPVTNRQFQSFVDATGYRTEAEIPPDPSVYPGLPPEAAVAGSLVFQRTPGPVPLDNPTAWWTFCHGADWRHPTGPASGIEDIFDHPVVHVTHGDAQAFAKWSGKSLPTEAEWELAARGGLDDVDYAWGNELAPGGAVLANYWRGLFPFANLREDGGYRTTPVGTFPPNGYGLLDMIGNVWEWTDDWFSLPRGTRRAKGQRSCCGIPDPRGGTRRGSIDPATPQIPIGRKVLKGGSHLCAQNYCQRYRPAARHAQMIESATSHIGFRCVMRPKRGR